MLKLLILDMDGVIFEGSNFWLEFHTAMGTRDAALELWHKLSKTDYVGLSRETAKIWKGRSAAPYFEMIRSRPYVPGIEKIFEFAGQTGMRTAIVSSGAYHLAMRAKNDFDVDIIRANRLGIDDSGCFDGTVDVQVDDARKDKNVRELQDIFELGSESIGVIGDGENDVPMARLASVSVGYRVNAENIRRHFTTNIRTGSVARAISALAVDPLPA